MFIAKFTRGVIGTGVQRRAQTVRLKGRVEGTAEVYDIPDGGWAGLDAPRDEWGGQVVRLGQVKASSFMSEDDAFECSARAATVLRTRRKAEQHRRCRSELIRRT
jgi:hypothetical protein